MGRVASRRDVEDLGCAPVLSAPAKVAMGARVDMLASGDSGAAIGLSP